MRQEGSATCRISRPERRPRSGALACGAYREGRRRQGREGIHGDRAVRMETTSDDVDKIYPRATERGVRSNDGGTTGHRAAVCGLFNCAGILRRLCRLQRLRLLQSGGNASTSRLARQPCQQALRQRQSRLHWPASPATQLPRPHDAAGGEADELGADLHRRPSAEDVIRRPQCHRLKTYRWVAAGPKIPACWQ